MCVEDPILQIWSHILIGCESLTFTLLENSRVPSKPRVVGVGPLVASHLTARVYNVPHLRSTTRHAKDTGTCVPNLCKNS